MLTLAQILSVPHPGNWIVSFYTKAHIFIYLFCSSTGVICGSRYASSNFRCSIREFAKVMVVVAAYLPVFSYPDDWLLS